MWLIYSASYQTYVPWFPEISVMSFDLAFSWAMPWHLNPEEPGRWNADFFTVSCSITLMCTSGTECIEAPKIVPLQTQK